MINLSEFTTFKTFWRLFYFLHFFKFTVLNNFLPGTVERSEVSRPRRAARVWRLTCFAAEKNGKAQRSSKHVQSERERGTDSRRVSAGWWLSISCRQRVDRAVSVREAGEVETTALSAVRGTRCCLHLKTAELFPGCLQEHRISENLHIF